MHMAPAPPTPFLSKARSVPTWRFAAEVQLRWLRNRWHHATGDGVRGETHVLIGLLASKPGDERPIVQG